MYLIEIHHCSTDCFVDDSVAASTQHSAASASPAAATANVASTGKLFSSDWKVI